MVIASDDAALLFMDEYGDRLFSGVPVVFTGGINNASNLPEAGEDTPFYIGTLEEVPLQEMVDAIRAINPPVTDTIYVILDNTYTGRAIRDRIDEQASEYTGTISFLYPEAGADISTISADLADLPETAAVLILTYYLSDRDLTPPTISMRFLLNSLQRARFPSIPHRVCSITSVWSAGCRSHPMIWDMMPALRQYGCLMRHRAGKQTRSSTPRILHLFLTIRRCSALVSRNRPCPRIQPLSTGRPILSPLTVELRSVS
ncbi:hypothetical protein [Methanogenium cariaci]|uniref:hypothetical protein n=1 Tax=Methanogenium cariaci TaxID=2197 RepID=UPI000782FCC0|nr:hypothetical protein [Methanogenium cariaci]